jgi:5'-deoxy-5'-methylthioadenosine phosphorylase
MSQLAIIGGTGLTSIQGLQIKTREVIHTPYGEPSGPVVYGELAGNQVMFLPRHGPGHTIPPHRINYRANIWALKEAGASDILAINAVGGIHPEMGPGKLVLPDQIIDYTWGRTSSYFEDGLENVVHIDFSQPYCGSLRQQVLNAAASVKIEVVDGGNYAATQGPRLETIAEINRLQRDGCDLVGMTGMPEAALAREQGLCYASLSVVANWAAGRGEAGGEITMAEIEKNLNQGIDQVRTVLECLVARCR